MILKIWYIRIWWKFWRNQNQFSIFSELITSNASENKLFWMSTTIAAKSISWYFDFKWVSLKFSKDLHVLKSVMKISKQRNNDQNLLSIIVKKTTLLSEFETLRSSQYYENLAYVSLNESLIFATIVSLTWYILLYMIWTLNSHWISLTMSLTRYSNCFLSFTLIQLIIKFEVIA